MFCGSTSFCLFETILCCHIGMIYHNNRSREKVRFEAGNRIKGAVVVGGRGVLGRDKQVKGQRIQ